MAAAAVLAVAVVAGGGYASASGDRQAQRVAVSGVEVSAGPAAGELSVSWDPHGAGPVDYRVAWASHGEPFAHYSDAGANAFPTGTGLVIAGLEPGAGYDVKVRARFGVGKSRWSAVATAAAATAPPASQGIGAPASGPPLTYARSSHVSTVGFSSTSQKEFEHSVSTKVRVCADFSPAATHTADIFIFTVSAGSTATVGRAPDPGEPNDVWGSGVDVNTAALTFTISVGQTEQCRLVIGNSDGLSEPDETLVFQLSDAGNFILDPAREFFTLTIYDDDPRPVVSVSGRTGVEGGENDGTSAVAGQEFGNVLFDFELDRPFGAPITLGLSYGGTATRGADFEGPDSFVIPEGSTSATLKLPVTDDDSFEPGDNETVRLTATSTDTASAHFPDEEIDLSATAGIAEIPPSVDLAGITAHDIAKRRHREIVSPGDSVWYELPGLTQNRLYYLFYYDTVGRRHPQHAQMNAAEPWLTIYDSDGDPVVQDQVVVTEARYLQFMPDADGTYYLRVSSRVDDVGVFWMYYASRRLPEHRGDRVGAALHADCAAGRDTRCGMTEPGSNAQGNLKVGDGDWYKAALRKGRDARICINFSDPPLFGVYSVSSPNGKWPWLFFAAAGDHCTEYFTPNYTGFYEVRVGNYLYSELDGLNLTAAQNHPGIHYDIRYELR